MKLYELAKKTGIPVDQLKDELGYTSHLKKLSDEEVAQYLGEKKITTGQEGTQTADSAETVFVNEIKNIVESSPKNDNPCPVDMETLATSLRGAGNKSPYWEWRHLVSNG